MNNARLQQPCPCGKTQKYIDCCGRFIELKQRPDTAEELMRSRYTAYTMANVDYIQASMMDKAVLHFDPLESKLWAQKAKWKRLKIIRSFGDEKLPEVYFVEFVAHYIYDGKAQKIHEISQFKRIEGKWFYTDGEQHD